MRRSADLRASCPDFGGIATPSPWSMQAEDSMAALESPIFSPTSPHIASKPVQSSFPLSVNGWMARPMPFNTEKHGDRAFLSGDNSIVERIDPEMYDDGCLAYTSRPLPLGRVWSLMLTVNMERTWKGLVSGWMLTKL